MRIRFIVAACAAALSFPAGGQLVQPGEWKIDSTTSSPRLPKPQSTSFTRCMKKEELDEMNRGGSRNRQSDCKVTSEKKAGNATQWEMSCPAEGMSMSGTVRYSADSFDSDTTIHGSHGGQKYEMRTRTVGKRLGPCK